MCTATISGAQGSDKFAVTTYAGTNATGAVLSVGSVEAQIGGQGKIGVNALSIAIDGVIASLRLRLAPKVTPRGKPATAHVSLDAFDASGAAIVGPSDFQLPIALTIQGDATHAFRLHAVHESGESLTIVKPTDKIELEYDGDKQASPITVQADVTGPQDPTASAQFGLHGKPPPPPLGTIYVLNLGPNDGRSASVTEYDGSADGNVAPVRVLQLDAKAYARSIAIDPTGRLYVGYLDSALGFSPGTGQPDKNNIVAVYAAGASGQDAPIATLNADAKTKSTLFPIAMAFDPGGDFVTYGATTVDHNTGDAMLTYAPSASGPVAPAHGWNFSSPVINYAGPSGLALDAAGNFYLSGALKAALGQSYGVFVASSADVGNPSADVARTLPWDRTTELTPGLANDVALDSSGEIFVSNILLAGSGSATSCQGRANVFAGGPGGGVTDTPPLRVLVLQGVFTADPTCSSSRNPLQPFFPAIQLYGTTLFVADDFNDAVSAFASSRGGIVQSKTRIAGTATLLDAPIAIAISPLSGSAPAEPVTGARAPARIRAQSAHLHRAVQSSIKE